jgi:hypothetical protein
MQEQEMQEQSRQDGDAADDKARIRSQDLEHQPEGEAAPPSNARRISRI